MLPGLAPCPVCWRIERERGKRQPGGAPQPGHSRGSQPAHGPRRTARPGAETSPGLLAAPEQAGDPAAGGESARRKCAAGGTWRTTPAQAPQPPWPPGATEATHNSRTGDRRSNTSARQSRAGPHRRTGSGQAPARQQRLPLWHRRTAEQAGPGGQAPARQQEQRAGRDSPRVFLFWEGAWRPVAFVAGGRRLFLCTGETGRRLQRKRPHQPKGPRAARTKTQTAAPPPGAAVGQKQDSRQVRRKHLGSNSTPSPPQLPVLRR